MRKITLVLSCEHAVNTVPEEYQVYFAPYQSLLETHRGFDRGAVVIAQKLSIFFKTELITAKATRLLIDCNRSLSHPHCFSEITTPLPKKEKAILIQQYYLPFRQQVEQVIKKHIEQNQEVWHLSLHSFTPTYNTITRNADIGLLYDPKRPREVFLAKHWQQQMKKQKQNLRIFIFFHSKLPEFCEFQKNTLGGPKSDDETGSTI